jgi:hypothetical protein
LAGPQLRAAQQSIVASLVALRAHSDSVTGSFCYAKSPATPPPRRTSPTVFNAHIVSLAGSLRDFIRLSRLTSVLQVKNKKHPRFAQVIFIFDAGRVVLEPWSVKASNVGL